MYIAKTSIPEDVRAIIARSVIQGHALTLPEQLDRATYLRVDKVLRGVGGKWDRKARSHLFTFDPRDLIGVAVTAGEFVDAKRTLGFFETPNELAVRMVQMAEVGPGCRVLEPSAGRGRIVCHLLGAEAQVDAIEVDVERARHLCTIAPIPDLTVWPEAFETFDGTPAYDAVVMNPPFAEGQDIVHIRRAWEFLRPGGRLVAICSEGPFFRHDRASAGFRDWLDEIAAVVAKLPAETFRPSGTDVNTRLVFATKADTLAITPVDQEGVIRQIPIAQIGPDPGQPRKVFDRQALSDLAASIRADGLLQPVTVRQIGPDAYLIVAGERRYRASLINRASTLRCIVITPADAADVRVKQIIENDQRVDVTPLEQARSYRSLMDESGWTAEQLGQRIGKAPFRITERLVLLSLSVEHQGLLASGNLNPSEAYEMARLSPRSQDVLFNAIRTGCRGSGNLRVMANALQAAEAQVSFLADDPDPPTKDERDGASAFEAGVERIAQLLRTGIRDNQVVAVRKVNPNRAAYLADLLAAMQKDLRRIEVSLREAAVQASFLAV